MSRRDPRLTLVQIRDKAWKPWLVSSTGRTSPLRTIRLDLGFDLFGRHGRHSGWNHLLPGGLHLSDTNCRESLAQDRFERARLKQALGGGRT